MNILPMSSRGTCMYCALYVNGSFLYFSTSSTGSRSGQSALPSGLMAANLCRVHFSFGILQKDSRIGRPAATLCWITRIGTSGALIRLRIVDLKIWFRLSRMTELVRSEGLFGSSSTNNVEHPAPVTGLFVPFARIVPFALLTHSVLPFAFCLGMSSGKVEVLGEPDEQVENFSVLAGNERLVVGAVDDGRTRD